MCGRFVSASPPEEIAAYFDATLEPSLEEWVSSAGLGPRWNVAPTDDVYVVYDDGSARRVDAFHWGLVPGWAKDVGIGNRLINARAETVDTNNSFKSSFARRRCIVPADGFYEWKKVEGQKKKQPFYVTRTDGEPLAFAGLWAEWHGEVAGEQVVVRSTTIITTSANETMAPVHDRMPVVLPPESWDEWLDHRNLAVARLKPLLVPAAPGVVTMRPVSVEVSNVRNDGAHLVDEIPASEMVGAGEGEQQSLL